MKTLTLKNGDSLNFTDSSTIYDLVTVVNDSSDIDSIRKKLTKENLSACSFNDEDYTLIIPVNIQASTEEMSGNITVHFITRDMTNVEKLQESQNEQDDVLNYVLFNS